MNYNWTKFTVSGERAYAFAFFADVLHASVRSPPCKHLCEAAVRLLARRKDRDWPRAEERDSPGFRENAH